MTLRPYQVEPVARLSKSRRALLEARAASGKTVMVAVAIRRIIEARKRTKKAVVGWVANTTEQVNQAYQAMLLAFFERNANAAVAKSHWDHFSSGLMISFRANCAAAGRDYSDCDLLVVDECHHAQAPAWRAQVETCAGARWGLTATPNFEGEDAEEKAAILRRLFSDNVIRVDAGEVAKTLAQAKVILLDPKWADGLAAKIDAETERVYRGRLRGWGGDPQKLRAMVLWQKCVEIGIVKNEARNREAQYVAKAHAERGDSVLVLVNQVEHAKDFAARVGGVACYSGMGAKARRHALYDFKTGKLKCLVATSLADEGLDVPRASVLVLVSGGRSKTKAEQRTGRVLRAFAGKEHGLIYDFEDTGHRLMAKHAASRFEVYERLGYEFAEDLPCLSKASEV
jgi:superfamily II DNA or RNA helicase